MVGLRRTARGVHGFAYGGVCCAPDPTLTRPPLSPPPPPRPLRPPRPPPPLLPHHLAPAAALVVQVRQRHCPSRWTPTARSRCLQSFSAAPSFSGLTCC